MGGDEKVAGVLDLGPHGNRVNPKSILVQTAEENQGFVLLRFGDVDVDEELVDGGILVLGGQQPHDIDAHLFVAVAALQNRTVRVQSSLHDRERRRRTHFLLGTCHSHVS